MIVGLLINKGGHIYKVEYGSSCLPASDHTVHLTQGSSDYLRLCWEGVDSLAVEYTRRKGSTLTIWLTISP